MLCSFFLVSFSHAYMQSQWRSGIDDDSQHPLLVSGPFKRTRNPIFKGVLLGQLGLFLTFPSLFTLVCLITGVTMICLQVRQEEIALEKSHGDVYIQYKQKDTALALIQCYKLHCSQRACPVTQRDIRLRCLAIINKLGQQTNGSRAIAGARYKRPSQPPAYSVSDIKTRILRSHRR